MLDKYELLNQTCKIEKKVKRVAAYCRVSTDSRDQANSFENQQKYFRNYIEHHPDWELCEIFADKGVSGTSTKHRVEFLRMIECAKNGQLDVIITKEISRFARNLLDSVGYTRELKKHGVEVIFLTDNIRSSDPEFELRLSILSSLAQEESRRTSNRVKFGQAQSMRSGRVFGRSLLGYDVKDGKMSINEEGAKIVRLIFHKFVNENKGTHTIARELREEGIKPMRVQEWSNTTILRTLRNEKYCGDLVQQKTYTPDYLTHEKKYNRGEVEFIIIKDHHEPIISRELFEEANRILDERSLSPEGKAKHSNRYPFSGKIKCGKCGSSYVARYRTRQNGSQYKSWRCAEGAKHGGNHTDKAGNEVGCSSPSIRNDEAIHIMYLAMKNLKINREKLTKNLLKEIKTVISSTSNHGTIKLQKDLDLLCKKRDKLLELYMEGNIEKTEFLTEREKIDTQINEIKSQLDSIENGNTLKAQQDQLLEDIEKTIIELLNGVEYEDEFYKRILDKMVVVDKNTIDLYLNLLPEKWRFTVGKTVDPIYKCASVEHEMPISVKIPTASL